MTGNNTFTSDSVVVGGGLIGMLTARELVRQGRKVVLLEQGQTGSESSWAGGGILSPLYPWRYAAAITRLARISQQRYAEYCTALHEESGIDPEYTRSGMLMLALSEAERDQAGEWAEAFSYRLDFPQQQELVGIQKNLGKTAGYAAWMDDVAQVRNPRLLASLRRSIELSGVKVLENHEVTSIESRDGRVAAAVVGTQRFAAAEVVICSGAWSDRVLESTASNAGIYPVKGQMLLFQGEPGSLERIVLSRDHYLIPRRDGHILVGSTMEHTGYDKSLTVDARSELMAAAQETFPPIAEFPLVKQWAGLRPGRKDGIPCISRHPSLEGLYINAGHYRNGVVTGLASVQLLVAIMTGAETELPEGDYAF